MYICDECIDLSNEILAENETGQAHGAGSAGGQVSPGLAEADALDAGTSVIDDFGTQIATENSAHGSVLLLFRVTVFRVRVSFEVLRLIVPVTSALTTNVHR